MTGASALQRPVANIGPKERRKRLLTGLLALIIAFGALALLVASGAHRTWRLALFAPFWLAALGYFQARERT